MKLSKLIAKYNNQLIQKRVKRNSDQEEITITVFADNASKELRNSVYQAHQESLPSDWIFGTYADILQKLEDYTISDIDDVYEYRGEIVDSLVDVYTADLTKWLADSVYNVEYLTQALEEYDPKDGFQLLTMAQYLAIDEVFGYVCQLLESK